MVTLYRNVFEEAGLQDMGLKYNSAGTLAAAEMHRYAGQRAAAELRQSCVTSPFRAAPHAED